MTEEQPIWARIIFSLVPLLMGLIILGAWIGFVPTDGGAFNAPPVVILSLAGGLILFSLLVWVPRGAPNAVRIGLPAILLLAIVVVCNWTAFAPGIRYTSEVTIGPWSATGEDQIGGRIAFGVVALLIDVIVLVGVFEGLRRLLQRR